MKRLRHWISALLALALLAGAIPTALAAGEGYTDVPGNSWAVSYIEKAREYGLMQGIGGGKFGYGQTLSRAEAVQLLCNLMRWEQVAPETPTFTDVAKGSWYFTAVETYQANAGLFVYEPGAKPAFGPDVAISRQEMAEVMVRALGLRDAAAVEEHQPDLFTDTPGATGYIQVVATLGLMQGDGDGTFRPEATLKREEAAAILVRFYEKYYAETDFVHGFYAFSSYSQRDLARQMDAVTYQWSEMRTDGTLDTAGGDCKIPESYDSILNYLGDGVKQHLGVFMASDADKLLLSETARVAAVQSILAELDRTYELVGKNPYSGVTIDFEGLEGAAVKAGFNAFLEDLSAALHEEGKTLYVAVQPAVDRAAYFDGFDYRAIGRLSDKVILMAHDYAPLTVAGYGDYTTLYEKAALTPIGQVYYSLKAALDSETGVEDPSKLVLAISIDAQGWEIGEDNQILSSRPISINPLHMEAVLAAGVEDSGFAGDLQNPWAIYRADDGTRLFAWYEDAQSVQAKVSLAKCFGVTGVSVWRLGNIPGDSAFRQALGLEG